MPHDAHPRREPILLPGKEFRDGLSDQLSVRTALALREDPEPSLLVGVEITEHGSTEP